MSFICNDPLKEYCYSFVFYFQLISNSNFNCFDEKSNVLGLWVYYYYCFLSSFIIVIMGIAIIAVTFTFAAKVKTIVVRIVTRSFLCYC